MSEKSNWANRLCCSVLIASVFALNGIGTAFAEPKDRPQRSERGDQHGNRAYDRDGRRDYRHERSRRWSDSRHHRDARRSRGYREMPYRYDYRQYRREPAHFYRGKSHGVPRDRVRWYRNVIIVRPHGHWYPGYAHYYYDDDAYKWLAFTAITLGILDYLNEQQQRAHEAAQVSATTAPIGERIIWQQGAASGAVVATREGTSTTGRYCREFMHEVTIGGRSEQAYGTACRNPDGSWEVVSIE